MASKNKKNKQKKHNGPSMAELADKHIYYEESVQCVESEIDFVDETFAKIRKRKASTLREDFCGTTNTSCEWVKRRKTNTAISIDLDNDVLDWGKKNKILTLSPEQKKRISVINKDVLKVKTKPVDIVLAMNFSYWLLKERKLTIEYFKKIYKSLVDDGIFFLDAYGGYEAFQEMTEKTKHKTFTYIWDQHRYNPITGISTNYIHFKFKDGSKIMKAFTYEWRIWTLPELLEMLTEAGFKATVYWEQADEDGEGNGVFIPEMEGDADAGWIAYLVAEK
ncbi:MAG: class I SAM-dependent methyltransferase [Proteobacteria bacterium]|nr:class I SAM-dependent methyltransferase [Pseudomonadota bacterium]